MSKALCVATKCTTADQFIESFYRFCDEQTFFVATLNQRPIGLETPFSINLLDRTPMLRGLCVVLDAWSSPANPYGRPGIRLGIRRLTPESEELFKQLSQRRAWSQPVSQPVSDAAEAEAPASTPPPTPPAVPPPIPAPAVAASPPAAAVQHVVDAPTTPVYTTTKAGPVIPSVIAQIEQRTPGSDIVLPANPLMNLSDESLEGFVDCTVYEETGNFFRAEPDLSGGEALLLSDADLAEPPPPPDFSPAAPTRRPTPPPASIAAPGVAPPVAAAPMVAAPVVAAPPPRPVAAPPPMPAYATPPKPAIGRETDLAMAPIRRAKNRTYMMAGGAAGLAALLVFAIVQSSSASTDERPVAAPVKKEPAPATPKAKPNDKVAITTPSKPEPAEPTEPTKPATTATTDPPPGEEADPPPPANPNGAPLVGTGPCQLDVTTTPAGTRVVVDGKEIGPSPISIAGPCEKHKVDLVHPRYKLATHFVALTQGKPKKLDVTLMRPTHQLVIKTTPPGATISIQGRRAGTSPTTVALMGFSGIDVTITRPGYETVTKRVYSKTPNETISVALKRHKW